MTSKCQPKFCLFFLGLIILYPKIGLTQNSNKLVIGAFGKDTVYVQQIGNGADEVACVVSISRSDKKDTVAVSKYRMITPYVPGIDLTTFNKYFSSTKQDDSAVDFLLGISEKNFSDEDVYTSSSVWVYKLSYSNSPFIYRQNRFFIYKNKQLLSTHGTAQVAGELNAVKVWRVSNGVYLEKDGRYKWAFITDEKITACHVRLDQEPIQRVLLWNDYLVIIMSSFTYPMGDIFVLNPVNGQFVRIFKNLEHNKLDIKNKKMILDKKNKCTYSKLKRILKNT